MRWWRWGIAVVLVASLSCSPAARQRVKRFFFEIPEEPEPAVADAATEEPAAEGALPTLRIPETRFRSFHPPVRARQCLACHDNTQRNHLRDNYSDVCASCHPRFYSDEVEHDPVASGDCDICHLPHRSEYRSLLADRVYALCIQCHDPEDLSEDTHDPEVQADCSMCHDPHFGESPFLKPGHERPDAGD